MPQLDGVDRNNPVPLYLQIKALWQNQIAAGLLKPGDQLPPEHELCRMYGVSPITVKQAMKALVTEGVLTRERGRGTFVTRPKLPAQELTRLSSVAEELEAAGLQATAEVVRREKVLASDDLAEFLGVSGGEPLIHVERVYHAGPDPLAVEQLHVPARICPDLLEIDLGRQSIYRIFEERYGLKPVVAEQYIESIAAEGPEARLLRLPEGSPILRAERITSLPDGRTAEYSQILYRGDRHKFHVTQLRART